MESEETATWINWVHLETQALLKDLNEEIRLQNKADNPFTNHIVYTPTNLIHEATKVYSSQEPIRKQKVTGGILPGRHEQQPEEKLASPLPMENTGKPLPQCMNNKCSEIPPTDRDVRSKPPAYTTRANTTRRQIHYDNMNWDGSNTSYMPLPTGRQQMALKQFSINDATYIRLCYRCGKEGHIRKYCKTNIHCEFCKSYTHHTSYANFMRAHPMASSRRTSPAQVSKQQEWIQEPTEETITSNIKAHSFEESLDEREVDRRRELSEITRRHLERVINTMIPSSGCSSVDPVDSVPVNSMVTQPSERDIEGLEFKQVPKEKEKQVIVNKVLLHK